MLAVSRIEDVSDFLTLSSHQGFVLTDLKLLAVNDAGSFWAGFVFVIGILLKVGFAETGLFLVVWLLLGVRHGLPFGT